MCLFEQFHPLPFTPSLTFLKSLSLISFISPDFVHLHLQLDFGKACSIYAYHLNLFLACEVWTLFPTAPLLHDQSH